MSALTDLELIAQLQEHVKRLSMTYQRSLKEEIAADLGLRFDDVDLPYDQWAAIRDPWLAKHNRCN